jgi:hypothetical protein
MNDVQRCGKKLGPSKGKGLESRGLKVKVAGEVPIVKGKVAKVIKGGSKL